MNRVLTLGFWKRSFQMLLSVSLAIGLLSAGSLVHAASLKSQAFTCQSTPTNFALPANFDLLHASTQELRQHYLPSRPPASNQQAVVHWLKLVQGIKHVVCLAPGGLKATYHGKPVISTISCNNPPSGTKCNRNWTGYVAGNNTQPGFNDVYGDWNVQCVNGAKSPYGSLMTSWVGLGGDKETDLWQAGSGWDTTLGGYYLWYEAVGGTHQTQGEQVVTDSNGAIIHPSCGSDVHTEVWFAPQQSTVNVGGLIFNAGTEYWYGFAPSGFSSGNLTAEWIDERPACDSNGDTFSLADYNYSQWSDAYASPNNATAPYYSIGSFAHTRVWTSDYSNYGGGLLSWADALGSNNGGSGTDNFKTYWHANGVDLC